LNILQEKELGLLEFNEAKNFAHQSRASSSQTLPSTGQADVLARESSREEIDFGHAFEARDVVVNGHAVEVPFKHCHGGRFNLAKQLGVMTGELKPPLNSTDPSEQSGDPEWPRRL